MENCKLSENRTQSESTPDDNGVNSKHYLILELGSTVMKKRKPCGNRTQIEGNISVKRQPYNDSQSTSSILHANVPVTPTID